MVEHGNTSGKAVWLAGDGENTATTQERQVRA
jgi:hypothetical protein